MASALWTHPWPASTNIDGFRRYVNREHKLNLSNYQQLHTWSVTDIPAFSIAVWKFCGITHSVPPTSVGKGLDSMWPPPEWFPGARLNFTENLLRVGLAARPEGIAVTACREGQSEAEELTYVELERRVAIWANAFRKMGVIQGDRIATVLTNSIDALLILLAAGSIGAIFSSTSPDMGAKGIEERFSQLKPKVFLCETEVMYAGKRIDLRVKLTQALNVLEKSVTELKHTIVVNGPTLPGKNVKTAAAILDVNATRIEYAQLPFDHPIYILYTSGTTGPPKCICHSAGGALLQQKKELLLQANMGINSVYYQYTTTGWMMWNYMIAALSCGVRIVLYDGSPLYPSPRSQLDMIERHSITHWGTSPKFLAALKSNEFPQDLDLSSLQIVKSAGSPLTPDLYNWFYSKFPKNIGLFSGSGGTDLVGSIVSGNPLSPIHIGEITGAALGMKVEIWSEDGINIEDTGENGELVIVKPFFSMPVGFWGPGGQERYRKAYFDKFPGIWCHGDLITKNAATGGYRILGRSDGILNPGGVRFGTAELYGVLDYFPQVEDCIAVGRKLPDADDEQVLLFVKLRHGQLGESLRKSIETGIKTQLSARHVPAEIHQVKDIPYTVNGKKIENLVRDVVSGKPGKVSGTAANPECLEEYRKFARPVKKGKLSKL